LVEQVKTQAESFPSKPPLNVARNAAEEKGLGDLEIG
jgi:hypothetical protein